MEFTPTLFHKQVLNEMPLQAKKNAKACVEMLGYYGAINFIIEQSEGKVDEKMAQTIADIAMYMIPEINCHVVYMN